MDELIAELCKLGANAGRNQMGDLVVNGQRVTVDTKTQGKKTRYEIGVGGKRCASARNAAYHIIVEYLPNIKRRAEMRNTIEMMRTDLPDDAQVWMMPDGEVRIKCRDAEQLKRVVRHLAERAQ